MCLNNVGLENMSASDGLFLVSYCNNSKRHAILSDDGRVGVLYLHAPSADPNRTGQAVASAYAYNRISLIPLSEVQSYRPDAPPIADGYGSDQAVIQHPEQIEWEFLWSDAGDSVLLTRSGEPWCIASCSSKHGHTKAVRVEGPWGKPWDARLE